MALQEIDYAYKTTGDNVARHLAKAQVYATLAVAEALVDGPSGMSVAETLKEIQKNALG